KNGYALRDWESFRSTLMALISKDSAKFIAAYKDNDLKGAILLVKSGNFYTYILGGSKKEKPDLLAGHFLQWEAIKLSLVEKADGYNISLGGSKGVVEFKNSFNSQQLLFSGSRFHWVLRPTFFRLYLFFEKRVKPHKQLISKMLYAMRKRR
ncbi:MAG: peptidoglycan bridge formation glycyltransferase FemA/FemB family protein, partial [Flavobacterium sp.]